MCIGTRLEMFKEKMPAALGRCLIGYLLSAVALPASAQVVSNSNQIRGFYELTNVNPEILEVATVRNLQVIARSVDQDPVLVSTSNGVDGPTRSDFELTVEAGEAGAGIAYELELRFLYVPNQIFNSPRILTAPVEEEPAPDVEVEIRECLSLIRVRTVSSETGEPYVADQIRGVFRAVDELDNELLRSRGQANRSDRMEQLAPADGKPARLNLIVNYGEVEGLPLLRFFEQVELPDWTCDQVYDITLQIPPDDREPPEEVGGLTGTFDLVGEEVHRVLWSAGENRFLSGPFPQSFDDFEVPVDPRLLVAAVEYHSGRGLDFQESRTTRDHRVPVETGQVTDLGNRFVMTPGRLQADVHLVGPPDEISGGGESCLADLYREDDRDHDGDGVLDSFNFSGSYVTVRGFPEPAPGAQHGVRGVAAVREMPGSFDARLSEVIGDIDFALGHLDDEDAFWQPWTVRYRFLDLASPQLPETASNSRLDVTDQLQVPVLVQPGSASRQRDVRHCFSEVRVNYQSLTGTFFKPRLTGIGSFDGVDFDQQLSRFETRIVSAEGTPLRLNEADDEGLVRACLPQGRYSLTPEITAVNPGGGTTNQTLETIDLDVGCRQVIDVRSDLQLALDEVPRCVPEPGITLTGSAAGSFEIESIVADVDGIETPFCSGDCGQTPTFSIPIALEPCNNSVSVTATDSRGETTRAAAASLVDTAPPSFGACDDVQVFVESPASGTEVTFAYGGVDACDGTVPAVCDRPSGSFFPLGDTVVTCEAVDRCGFRDTCSFTVAVSNETVPNEGKVPRGNDLCRLDDFDGATVDAAWTLTAVGDADQATVFASDGGLQLTGTGSSLHHDPEDHGSFLWRPADPGDFRAEITVTGVPLDLGGEYRKATLMARAGTEADAPRIAVSYVPHFPGGPSVMFDLRATDGTARALGSTVPNVDLPVHLAIERRGDDIRVYLSRDGREWIRPAGGLGGAVTLDLGDRPLVGPIVTSYDPEQPVTFAFDGFSLCEPIDPIPATGGVCDGSDLDIVYLLDQSGGLGRLLDDGEVMSAVARDTLARMDRSLALEGRHRAAVLTAKATAPPLDYPPVVVTVEQELTSDFEAVDGALHQVPRPSPEDATPLADALRGARELLEQTGSDRRPVIVWVTDGLATVDDAGNGPAFYLEPEVAAVPLLHPDGTFRSRGEVAWSGSYNSLVDTYDGEASADSMAELERLIEDFPDLRVLTLMPVSAARPGFRDLPDYAAHLTSGAVVSLTGRADAGTAAVELLDHLACGESAGGTVAGVVWHDVDGNGEVDAGEAPLDGITVRLIDGALSEVATQATVDGAYLFTDLAPGTYSVEVDSAELPPELTEPTQDPDGTDTPDTASVTVGPWDVVSDLRFGYRPAGGPLSGCLTDAFDDLEGAWTLVDLGDADQSAAVVTAGRLHLAGDGSALYAGSDHGAFLYRPIEGDFVAEVDIAGFPENQGGPYRKGGLMIRTGLGSFDPRLMVQYAPSWNNGSQTALQFRYRATLGGPGDEALGSNLFQVPLPARLRIAREGDTFRVAFSNDGGTTWVTPTGGTGGSVDLPWGETLLLGLNAVSYDPGIAFTVAFDDFQACAPDAVP